VRRPPDHRATAAGSLLRRRIGGRSHRGHRAGHCGQPGVSTHRPTRRGTAPAQRTPRPPLPHARTPATATGRGRPAGTRWLSGGSATAGSRAPPGITTGPVPHHRETAWVSAQVRHGPVPVARIQRPAARADGPADPDPRRRAGPCRTSHARPGQPVHVGRGPGDPVERDRQLTGEQPRSEHLPIRPSWDCAACGHPWPCAIAKETMLTEFREHPSVLTIYMSARLNDAFDDLTAGGAQAPPDLYDRFLCWIVIAPRASPDDRSEPEPLAENDRLPRQGLGRPPSDPTAQPADPGHDAPRRGGGSPPTRSDPSNCGHPRLRPGPPIRPNEPLDL
jgi:hypothetical protein